jgi:hypothetical protein
MRSGCRRGAAASRRIRFRCSKYDLGRLLPDNGIQPARQMLDLFRDDYTQSDLT